MFNDQLHVVKHTRYNRIEYELLGVNQTYRYVITLKDYKYCSVKFKRIWKQKNEFIYKHISTN